MYSDLLISNSLTYMCPVHPLSYCLWHLALLRLSYMRANIKPSSGCRWEIVGKVTLGEKPPFQEPFVNQATVDQ